MSTITVFYNGKDFSVSKIVAIKYNLRDGDVIKSKEFIIKVLKGNGIVNKVYATI
jgi:hypothetical protein